MAEKSKILYVEDDESLAFLTKDNLEEYGYEIDHYADGVQAWEAFQKSYYDVCVFDVMLPLLDGFELAEKVREINSHIPIIFVTAKSMNEDKITGLKIGGDDYITKPFSIEELMLKIEVFLKRKNIVEDKKEQLTLGIFRFEPDNLSLYSDEDVNKLTQKESDLLLYLIENKNSISRRENILKKLWGENDYFLGRSMDVFISRLRKYIRPDENLKIENIHGVGFRLIDKNEASGEEE